MEEASGIVPPAGRRSHGVDPGLPPAGRSRPTPVMHRGSAVAFPVQAGQEVTLRFAGEDEVPR